MADVKTNPTAAAVKPASDAEKLAKLKEAKKEAAKKFKERRAQEKADRITKSKKLIESLKKQGVYDKLDAEAKAFLEGMANPTVANAGTSSFFNVMFGASPKAGDSVKLADVFNKTLKGKAQIDHYVKKWAESGRIVTFKQDAANILNSTYVIEKL